MQGHHFSLSMQNYSKWRKPYLRNKNGLSPQLNKNLFHKHHQKENMFLPKSYGQYISSADTGISKEQTFLPSTLFTLGGEDKSLFTGGCPVQCGVVNGIPTCYPRDASGTLTHTAVTINEVSTHCQRSPQEQNPVQPIDNCCRILISMLYKLVLTWFMLHEIIFF